LINSLAPSHMACGRCACFFVFLLPLHLADDLFLRWDVSVPTGPGVVCEETVLPMMFLLALPEGVANGLPVRGPAPTPSPWSVAYDRSSRHRGLQLAVLAIASRSAAVTLTGASFPSPCAICTGKAQIYAQSDSPMLQTKCNFTHCFQNKVRSEVQHDEIASNHRSATPDLAEPSFKLHRKYGATTTDD
jgi:hypothetical protein